MANPYRRPLLGSTHRWQIGLWLKRNPWFAVLMLALLLSLLTYLAEDKYSNYIESLPVAPVVCNGDVKECVGGSTVVRVGPECKFADCPELEPGDKEAYEDLEVKDLPAEKSESEEVTEETGTSESKSDEPVQQEEEGQEQTGESEAEQEESSEDNSTSEE